MSEFKDMCLIVDIIRQMKVRPLIERGDLNLERKDILIEIMKRCKGCMNPQTAKQIIESSYWD